jgi:hypothetical protein
MASYAAEEREDIAKTFFKCESDCGDKTIGDNSLKLVIVLQEIMS